MADNRYSTVIPRPDATPAPPRPPMSALSATPLASLCLALLALFGGVLFALPLALVSTLMVAGLALPVALLALIALLPLVKALIITLAWTVERETGRDVTGDGIVGSPPGEPEKIRLLPVRGGRPEPRLVLAGDEAADGYSERDLDWLLQRAWTVGHVTRLFLGQTLPSGRPIGTIDDLEEFYRLLEGAGLLEGRGPRQAGRLVGTLDEARAAFGLH